MLFSLSHGSNLIKLTTTSFTSEIKVWMKELKVRYSYYVDQFCNTNIIEVGCMQLQKLVHWNGCIAWVHGEIYYCNSVRVFGKLYHTTRGRWYIFACGLLWWPFCAETYSLAHNVASYLGTNMYSGCWGHPFSLFPFQKLINLISLTPSKHIAKHWIVW